jgi:hypothetical protein
VISKWDEPASGVHPAHAPAASDQIEHQRRPTSSLIGHTTQYCRLARQGPGQTTCVHPFVANQSISVRTMQSI